MAKSLSEARLTTRSARAALSSGVHWRAIDPDIHLGYRKATRGGRWLVRWYAGQGKYHQSALGVADDFLGEGTLSYETALKAARQAVECSRRAIKAACDGPVATVRSAMLSYIAERDQRETSRQGRPTRSDASRRLTKHLLSDENFSNLPLHRLSERDLASWRARVDPKLKRVSLLRVVNDAKAAFNREHRLSRKSLPADFGETVRFGLRLDDLRGGGEPIARENQILADADVRKIIATAVASDVTGDFALLVVVLAATGARFSQVSRLCVRDVQVERSRILMPTSRKGRGRVDSFTPIPLGSDILSALTPVLIGRGGEERLLCRWRHVQIGPAKWERTSRAPWRTPSEMIRPWHVLCEKVGLLGTVPYALRHSSIVRGIRLGLPIRLVAAMHDTSVVMIERHYGRWVADGLEEIAARAVVPMLEAAPSV